MAFGKKSIKNRYDFREMTGSLFYEMETNGKQPAPSLNSSDLIQAIRDMSSELTVEKLYARIMTIVLKQVKAERAVLLVQKEQEWIIVAEGRSNQNEIELLQIALSDAKSPLRLPLTIIDYVVQTDKTVLLGDPCKTEHVQQDQYLLTHCAHSLLCVPLIHQHRIVGILYLEHPSLEHAFTPHQVERILLLSTQAAISLENAQQHHAVQEDVVARRHELHQVQRELKAAQQQLVESEKMSALGGLVAGVAHEINTPVGVCLTAASHLAQKTNDFVGLYRKGRMKRSDLERYIKMAGQSSDMILTNINRAAELIESFKQVAVDQSSQERRLFYLKAYLENVLRSLEPKLKQTRHTIQVKGDATLRLNSYPGTFSQIVTNFVMNSIIHAYEPEEAGQLCFELKQKDESIILEYSDDGKGIHPDYFDQIFKPFFTTKRGEGGSGLGLHIIHKLVTETLGGYIRCQSEIGKGTKFIIELPIDHHDL